MLNIIGEGGFGCVFQVRNKYDQSEYAIKRIPVENEFGSIRYVYFVNFFSVIPSLKRHFVKFGPSPN